MSILPKDVGEALKDPDTIKVLTTTDEDGAPHSVVKQSIIPLEDGNLAYTELIERSRTYKNMLRNHWAGKMVSICAYNPKTGLAYQIKGKPSRYVVEGEIWSMMRDLVWSVMPDAEPAGAWVITPEEVINEDTGVRYAEEAKRMRQLSTWKTYPRKKGGAE